MKLLATSLMILLTLSGYSEDISKLTLSASAKISKPADELQMKIGVITHSLLAEDGLFENSSKMNEIIAQLELAGFGHDDYETNQFSVTPTYTPYPKNPPPDWTKTINGYEVKNFILIHTDQLEKAGMLIDMANAAGANSISDIKFSLRSCRDYWPEAIAAAGVNAVKDAEVIAAATGVKLVRVLSISLTETTVRASELNVACFAKAAGSAPPIEPGDVSIEARVNLVYEIY